VIFILTDDPGWVDAKFAGHPHVKPPNLDRLAKEGNWPHQFYIAATVCSNNRDVVKTLAARALAWNKTLPASPVRQKFIGGGQSKGAIKSASGKPGKLTTVQRSSTAGTGIKTNSSRRAN
jgi:hypothetical protein